MSADSIKRRGADGVVYERVGKRQIPWSDTESFVEYRNNPLHWCSGTGDNPARVAADTPLHVCFIWKVSDDQSWEPASTRSEPPSVDQLIQTVDLIPEETIRIQTLALLYQARALERIADSLQYSRFARRGLAPVLLPRVQHSV